MAQLRKGSLVGFFNDPDHLVDAAAQATDEGFRNLDAYSPYPIHGIEEVMRIRRSWIPAAALAMLFTGATAGFLLQWWTHAVDWPINVGGKDFFAWQAYVVIIFECAVLFAALTNFFSIFVSCRLFPNPFTEPLDRDLTNDRFALVIPPGRGVDETRAISLLKKMGADEIRKID